MVVSYPILLTYMVVTDVSFVLRSQGTLVCNSSSGVFNRSFPSLMHTFVVDTLHYFPMQFNIILTYTDTSRVKPSGVFLFFFSFCWEFVQLLFQGNLLGKLLSIESFDGRKCRLAGEEDFHQNFGSGPKAWFRCRTFHEPNPSRIKADLNYLDHLD